MKNPIGAAGFLTYGNGDAKHSNGRLFRVLTGSPYRIDKAIFSWFAKETKKLQQPVFRLLQPFFRNKKSQNPYLQTHVFSPRSSSSSDLRIVSSAQPSQVSPMTGFRHAQNLPAYSGGTVRAFHPVFYSPAVLLPHLQALKRNIYLRGQYTQIRDISQPQKVTTVIFGTKRHIIRRNYGIAGKSMFLDNPPCGQYIKGEVFDMTEAEMIQCAIDVGFAAAAIVDTTQIVFDPAFRPYCEENLCGQYGANYSCPPDCGSPEEMKHRILAHKKALVLQTIWQVADYTDTAAIKQAKKNHNAFEIRVVRKMREAGHDGLIVGASGCALCTPCTQTQGLPCKFPDLQYSCMSAYCIYVRNLADTCAMKYDCSKGLLGLFGMYVFD